MTYIEVIDSAVKIGLGAIIAGISALVLSNKQYSRELQKHKIAREFEILKQVAEELEIFAHAVMHFWASGSELHKKIENGDVPNDKFLERFANARKDFYFAFKNLASSESKLMLLGFNDARKAIREYGDLADEFTKRVVKRDEPMDQDECDEWGGKFTSARSQVYKHLSEGYEKLGT